VINRHRIHLPSPAPHGQVGRASASRAASSFEIADQNLEFHQSHSSSLFQPANLTMSLADAETKMSSLLSSSKDSEIETLTLDNLEEALSKDTKIKLAGVDIDGILRGKIVSKKKFLSVAKDGFGFCSVIFGCELSAPP
jgi:hypothetical protein